MNYFELYPGDYQRDTAALTLSQHGAFLLLLMTYYSTEKPIPSDNPTLFRIVRAMTSDEQSDVLVVADLFFPVSSIDGLRHNERADADIVKARIRIESSRLNGGKGGRPKKPSNNPVGLRNETQAVTQAITQTEPLQTPDPIHHTEQELKARAGATPAKSRGTRLPTDWSPDADLTAWAKAERPDVDLITELAKFRDHWKSAPGAKGVKLDWDATFRNWIRSARDGPPARAAGKPPIAQNFSAKTYTGTPDDELPAYLRSA